MAKPTLPKVRHRELTTFLNYFLGLLDSNGNISLDSLAIDGFIYRGDLDASLGAVPTVGNLNDYYEITVAGTIASTYYGIGDRIVFNGTSWVRKSMPNSIPIQYVTKTSGAELVRAERYVRFVITSNALLTFPTDAQDGDAFVIFNSDTSTANVNVAGLLTLLPGENVTFLKDGANFVEIA